MMKLTYGTRVKDEALEPDFKKETKTSGPNTGPGGATPLSTWTQQSENKRAYRKLKRTKG